MSIEAVSATRYFALFSGLCLGFLAILGLVLAGVTPMHLPMEYGLLRMRIDDSFVLGLFPVNLFSNLLMIAFGALGFASYFSGVHASLSFSRVTAVVFLALAILGLIPTDSTRTVFGLMPVYGNDIWLFAVLSILGFAFGFTPLGAVTDVPPTERIRSDVNLETDLFNTKHGPI